MPSTPCRRNLVDHGNVSSPVERHGNRFLLSFATPKFAVVMLLVGCLLRYPELYRHLLSRNSPEFACCARLIHDAELQLAAERSRPFPKIPDPPSLTVLQLPETLVGQNENHQKIVALVEIRNTRASLPSFIRALAGLVDSIVILDDHSSDGSRVEILKLSTAGSPDVHSRAPVELLINKTGPWVREELADRNILLRYGRAVGGTHFVLPDYDEYFSANCVVDGSLRKGILELLPGESLVLSWAEAWSSLAVQRVLPNDRKMNFLTRRQTIVFADDGIAEYTLETSGARLLDKGADEVVPETSSQKRPSTLHALRCPRSICPAPLRYRGPSTPLSPSVKVKTLPQCYIVELRFLNLDNLLLKAAWYESLGRSLDVRNSATHGKMMDYLYLRRLHDEGNESDGKSIFLEPLDKAWWSGYPFIDAQSLTEVERWRAEDILSWRLLHGDNFANGLRATSRIAFNEMQRSAPLPATTQVTQVCCNGRLVLALDSIALSYLHAFGEGEVLRESILEPLLKSRKSGTAEKTNIEKNDPLMRNDAISSVRNGIAVSPSSFAYTNVGGIEEEDLVATLKLLIFELPDVDIVLLRVRELRFTEGVAMGVATGPALQFLSSLVSGNVRLVETHAGVLGSVAGLAVLGERVFGAMRGEKVEGSPSLERRWLRMIDFAERMQSEVVAENGSLPTIPVARLIFSLNVGRSGSKYLSVLFDVTRRRGMVSLHEPACPENFCSGGGAIRMQDTLLSETFSKRSSVKLGMIRQSIAATAEKAEVTSRSTGVCRMSGDLPLSPVRVVREVSGVTGCTEHTFDDFVYSEMNPNFKSWIYDVVLKSLPMRGYAVDILVLRKYIPAVVRSLYNTGYFRERDGYNWMETAASVNSVLPSLSDSKDSGLDALDKIISYVLNTEALSRMLKKHYSGVARFIDVRSEDIYGDAGAMSLLKQLGLLSSTRVLKVAGVRVDKYVGLARVSVDNSSPRPPSVTTVSECERRVADYLRRCRDAGIQTPFNMTHAHRRPGFVYPL